MNRFVFVYVTTPDAKTAERIARTLVEEKLAACGNLLPGMRSIYRWQGKLERSRECVLILKTTTSNYRRCERRIVELHPYECPCVARIPVSGFNAPYSRWLIDALRPFPKPRAKR